MRSGRRVQTVARLRRWQWDDLWRQPVDDDGVQGGGLVCGGGEVPGDGGIVEGSSSLLVLTALLSVSQANVYVRINAISSTDLSTALTSQIDHTSILLCGATVAARSTHDSRVVTVPVHSIIPVACSAVLPVLFHRDNRLLAQQGCT